MRYAYYSKLSSCIEGLINQKQALGYSYFSEQQRLKQFDNFCISEYQDDDRLSEELGSAWAQQHDNEGISGFSSRISPIRELGRYMRRQGIDAYVIPTGLIGKKPRYIPYIFSQQELGAFFNAADRLPRDYRCPGRHIVVPIIFRVLYCCGMRPAEILKLRVCDVDLQTGKIDILQSKGHKDRFVVLSEDVLQLCRRYDTIIDAYFPSRAFFFPSSIEGGYSACWLRSMFRRCWEIDGEHEFQRTIRVYDFRHTFTTHRLYLWMDQKRDLNAWIPYLSTYLGHDSFSETAYYIHLVPEFFPRMAQTSFSQYADLIPEVQNAKSE